MPEPIALHINGRFLTQPLSGMQRYASEMVSALDRLFADDDGLRSRFRPDVLVPPIEHRRPDWRHFPIRTVGRMRGHAWEQIDLGRAASDGLLINLSAAGPLLHRRSVLVLHDAAIFSHPEHFSAAYRTLHRLLRPRLARRAHQLVTISDFSRRELARWCSVPEAAFSVIGDSAEHILHVPADPGILERNGLTPGRYALTVGNQSPNKNVALAVRGFLAAGLPEWRLAVAGGGLSRIFGSEAAPHHPSVAALGRVSDGELRALYENAGVFLFPSRYEGFGVPPLEAMILGCPVISSDASAMPEVLGEAAVYFPSDDVDALSSAMRMLATNPVLVARLKVTGIVRAHQFSWHKNASELLGLIESKCLTP